jgi:asparaginyl-tRNA synthetase
MMACAMSKVYTFGPTFRAEDSHTTRHLAEFMMLEPEIAWANLSDCMSLSESLIKSSIQNILTNNSDEIQFFNDRVDNTLLNRLKQTVDKKFDVIQYSEAVELLQKNKFKKGSSCLYEDIQFGMDLGRDHEKYLTEELFNNPVFVINWPKSIKPFYMRQNDDNTTVAAMDLLVPQVGEIVGGSAREDRHDLLEKAMKDANLLEEESKGKYQWYLELRQFGSVPHAGFGLGYERFIQYITGIKNIRDVIPSPRYKNSFLNNSVTK